MEEKLDLRKNAQTGYKRVIGSYRFELRTILNKSDLISMQLLNVAITLPRGQATANRTMSPGKMSAKKRKNYYY